MSGPLLAEFHPDPQPAAQPVLTTATRGNQEVSLDEDGHQILASLLSHPVFQEDSPED